MDSDNTKSKPLTKEETKSLISLIEKSKVIDNKATNATSNKLKSEEWVRIADSFNATTSCRRTPPQLRLKWENLKKNSRKRNCAIRINNLKTGGGPPDYIPPDDILDRVSTLLGSTVDGFAVELGGDAEAIEIKSSGDGGGGDSGGGDGGGGDGGVGGVGVFVECEPQTIYFQTEYINQEVILPPLSGSEQTPVAPKTMHKEKIFMNTPRASGSKRKLVAQEDGRAARNQALAEYYTVKKKFIDAKLQNILLQNEKLKLEVEELKDKK